MATATKTKTNERPGTRASVRYVRSSASKAREVLDLIRGKSYGEASEIVEFSERAIARTVKKCLDSAVANAETNNSIPGDELYVAACYADEGPTLKRWRPRARGRATRINKRTCHITIIVARYTPEQLQEIRDREALKGSGSASSNAAEARRRRVARSRQREEARAAAEHDHDHEEGEAAADDEAAESETEASVDQAAIDAAMAAVDDASGEEAADEEAADEEAADPEPADDEAADREPGHDDEPGDDDSEDAEEEG